MPPKVIKPLVAALLMSSYYMPTAHAVSLDAKIRRIVDDALRAKDEEIKTLKARLNELEKQAANPVSGKSEAKPVSEALAKPNGASEKPPEIVPGAPATAVASSSDDDWKWSSLFKSLKRKVERLAKIKEDDLNIHGFLDVTASANDLHSHTDFADSMQTQNFNMNVVELDVEYHFLEHFSGSAAFDWINNNYAFIGAAILDYHSFDGSTPARGRIFDKDGFHVQLGTFDIPFSLDYQYNATPDRLTVTTPITTQRMQIGTFNPNNMWAGWNATGLRVYGTWNQLIDYSAFVTNSVYGSPGRSVGGRLGFTFGQTPYRLHRQDSDHVVDIGFSFVHDWDKHERDRSQVYGLDFTFNYEGVQLLAESTWRRAYRPVDYFITNIANTQSPAQDDMAWHVTLIVNMDQWLKHPFYTFARYGQWRPDYSSICVNCNYQDATTDNQNSFAYAVGPIDQMSLGFGYRFNDNLLLKFEYLDSLGTATAEPYFEKSRTQGQLVVSF